MIVSRLFRKLVVASAFGGSIAGAFGEVELVNVSRLAADGSPPLPVSVVLFRDGSSISVPCPPGTRYSLPDGYHWEIAKPELWEDEKWSTIEGTNDGNPLVGGTVVIDRTDGNFDRLYVAYIPDPKQSEFFDVGFGFGCAIAGGMLIFWLIGLLRRPVLES